MNTRSLLKIIGYILDYAPIVATVIIAAIVSITQSDKPLNEMVQWVLLVLALLATTQLVDRFRFMRNLDIKVERLLENVRGPSGASAFFVWQIPSMRERLLQADSIYINGVTLSRTSDTFWDVFKQKIGEGAKIRILVVNPDPKILDVAVNLFHKHLDPNRLRREIEHSLDNFESLTAGQATGEAFQVRLLPCAPPYGIWLIDAGTPKAEIWVELYPFRSQQQPTFHLLPHRDGEWFAFFQRQFELMWNAGEEWHPIKDTAA